MGLAEVLERHSRPVFSNRLDGQAPSLEKTSREIGAIGLDGEPPPPPETLDAFVARCRDLLEHGKLAELGERDWRFLPWALWHGQPSLAEEPRIIEALKQRLGSRFRRRELHNLARAWLQDFGPDMPGRDQVASLLAREVVKRPWPWAERHQRFTLFDAGTAPARLADHVFHSDAGIGEALAEAGLETETARGMALAALRHAIRRFGEALREGRVGEAERARLCDWALDEDGGIAAEVRPRLAEALLEPWADGRPPESLRDPIEAFILRHYGDPRTKPRHWLGVSEKAQSVFKRWLVRLALDQFLDVIDRFALERHWRYRRMFWMAYYRAGHIDEAHVMFGNKGFREARRIFGRDVPCALLEAGHKHVESEHAVLLMRIGRLVVADWSHNGRCVVWPEEVAWAPQFNKSRYSSSEVYPDEKRGDWACRHAGSDRYAWQNKVRNHIYERTRIWLEGSAFEVR